MKLKHGLSVYMALREWIRCRPRIFNWLHRVGCVQPFSQTLPKERECLLKHAYGAKSVVEIGTFMGLTAGYLAESLPVDGILYCVDPYPPPYKPIEAIARRHLARNGMLERVRMIKAEIVDAVPYLPIEVDFFFVDGDHTHRGISTDWLVVKKLLKVGGVAAFHDTSRHVERGSHAEEAIRFFEQVIARDPQFECVDQVASLNVIRRR